MWRILDNYFVEFCPSFGVIRCFFMIRLSWYQCDVSQKCNCLLITSYQEVNRVGMFFSQFNCGLSLFVTYIAKIFFYQFVNCLLLCLQVCLSWKVLSFYTIKFIQFVLPLDFEWKLFSVLMLKRNLPSFFLVPVWQMAIHLF